MMDLPFWFQFFFKRILTVYTMFTRGSFSLENAAQKDFDLAQPRVFLRWVLTLTLFVMLALSGSSEAAAGRWSLLQRVQDTCDEALSYFKVPPHAPPGPRGTEVVLTALRLVQDPLRALVQLRSYETLTSKEPGTLPGLVYFQIPMGELIGRLGTLFRQRRSGYDGPVSEPPARILFVNNPSLLGEISHRIDVYRRGWLGDQLADAGLGRGVGSVDGAQWLKQRRHVQGAFNRSRIPVYGSQIIDLTDESIQEWLKSDVVDTPQAMFQLTLRIIMKILFGIDSRPHQDSISRYVKSMLRTTYLSSFEPTGILGSVLSSKPSADFLQGAREFERVVAEILQSHKNKRGLDPDGTRGYAINFLDQLLSPFHDGTLPSASLVRDEMVSMIAAGHETTAGALSWAFYVLSIHPDVTARLVNELRTDLPEGPLTTETLLAAASNKNQLKYLRATIQEVLRLYPSGYVFARETTVPVALGNFTVPQGTTVLISPYVLHRDASLWPDPERFDPSRFLSESPASLREKYIPFWGGQHTCIGEHLALYEMLLILAKALRETSFTMPVRTVMIPSVGVTLGIKELPLVFSRR